MDSSAIIKALLPLFGLLVLLFAFKFIVEIFLPQYFKKLRMRHKFRKGEARRSDQELLNWLRQLKPSEFEDCIADMFTRLGYVSSSVGRSHDGGIDVVIKKDGKTSYIQCKKFITRQVVVGAVRDFYGAVTDKLTTGEQGYFITTNVFTLEAKLFAEDKPIELIDGVKLIHYIRLANKDIDIQKTGNDTASDIKVCPKCGGSLAVKTGKFGKFMGCSNYPNCKFTDKV